MKLYPKIKLVLILCPLAAVLFSFTQNTKESRAKLMHYAGPVKQSTESEYEVYFDSTKTAVMRFKSKHTELFDPKGQSAGEIHYNGNGTITGSTVNKSNNRGEIIAADNYDSKGVLTKHSVYVYNNRGLKTLERDDIYNKGVLNTIKITHYDGKRRITKEVNTSYLQHKRTVTYSSYLPAPKKQQATSYIAEEKYNDKGQLAERIQYKPDGSIRSKDVYLYNSKGEKTEQDAYDSDTTGLVKTNETFFDSLGTVIKACHYSRGELKNTTTSTFVRDEHGNWITDSIFSNNKLTHLKQREIQYY